MTAYNPAATMRHAADYLRDRTETVFLTRLADWLDAAANEADEIGPNVHAERLAAAILGRPDPWPGAKPRHRPVPEAVVTYVEGVPQ